MLTVELTAFGASRTMVARLEVGDVGVIVLHLAVVFDVDLLVGPPQAVVGRSGGSVQLAPKVTEKGILVAVIVVIDRRGVIPGGRGLDGFRVQKRARDGERGRPHAHCPD